MSGFYFKVRKQKIANLSILFVCPFVCLSMCLSVFLFVSVSVCLCFYLVGLCFCSGLVRIKWAFVSYIYVSVLFRCQKCLSLLNITTAFRFKKLIKRKISLYFYFLMLASFSGLYYSLHIIMFVQ